MNDVGADELDAASHDESGPVFDLLAAKLRHPLNRLGTVRRSSLIEQLAGEDSGPVVSVVAPRGYGKTTLLAQWAERDGRAVPWVSVDEKDNEPKVLVGIRHHEHRSVDRTAAAVLDHHRPGFHAVATIPRG
jgi:hypothetical protein